MSDVGDRVEQEERIEAILEGLSRKVIACFDPDSADVRFVVRTEDGTLLTDTIAWTFEELQSISDEQIRNHIKQMGAGRI